MRLSQIHVTGAWLILDRPSAMSSKKQVTRMRKVVDIAKSVGVAATCFVL